MLSKIAVAAAGIGIFAAVIAIGILPPPIKLPA